MLSGLADIARTHPAMIESGQKNANAETLRRIADAPGVRLSDLIRMAEDESAV